MPDEGPTRLPSIVPLSCRTAPQRPPAAGRAHGEAFEALHVILATGQLEHCADYTCPHGSTCSSVSGLTLQPEHRLRADSACRCAAELLHVSSGRQLQDSWQPQTDLPVDQVIEWRQVKSLRSELKERGQHGTATCRCRQHASHGDLSTKL